MTPNEEWQIFLYNLSIIGENGELKGMAREIVNVSNCSQFGGGVGLYVITLEIPDEHKSLWIDETKDLMVTKIHTWLDDNLYGNVLLTVRGDKDQITVIPKTQAVSEKIAMYEKEHNNPTHH